MLPAMTDEDGYCSHKLPPAQCAVCLGLLPLQAPHETVTGRPLNLGADLHPALEHPDRRLIWRKERSPIRHTGWHGPDKAALKEWHWKRGSK